MYLDNSKIQPKVYSIVKFIKDDLNCRFCNTNVPETQEHLEICAGMEYERGGLDMALREGQLKFWMRVTVKLSKLAVATQPPRQGALN